MIQRLPFAHLPTPLEAMPRLSRALGRVQLLVKRDDQTGLALGGNKTRKLEFLLADAQARGARLLITAGALQSNHCRQTAAAAARFGFECQLVLVGQPPPLSSGNLLLDHLLGAELIWVEKARREAALQEAFTEAREQGREPYLIPYGGSNQIGALGYFFAVEEVLGQGVQADWMVLASSSGGTQAGLVAGARAFGFKGEILGISVDQPQSALQEGVARLAGETSGQMDRTLDFKPGEILVNADYCTPGYGVLTEPEKEAIRLFARFEGLILDPVYTGRAAAGMIDLIRRGFFKEGSTLLFWHTGGAPALFAEPYQGDWAAAE